MSKEKGKKKGEGPADALENGDICEEDMSEDQLLMLQIDRDTNKVCTFLLFLFFFLFLFSLLKQYLFSCQQVKRSILHQRHKS